MRHIRRRLRGGAARARVSKDRRGSQREEAGALLARRCSTGSRSWSTGAAGLDHVERARQRTRSRSAPARRRRWLLSLRGKAGRSPPSSSSSSSTNWPLLRAAGVDDASGACVIAETRGDAARSMIAAALVDACGRACRRKFRARARQSVCSRARRVEISIFLGRRRRVASTRAGVVTRRGRGGGRPTSKLGRAPAGTFLPRLKVGRWLSTRPPAPPRRARRAEENQTCAVSSAAGACAQLGGDVAPRTPAAGVDDLDAPPYL